MNEQNREPDTSSSALSPLFAGRYQIKALLGEGGYGTVYRAFDTQLGEDVALKVLRREIIEGPSPPGAPSVLDRFRNEVRLARRVTHPNVARMFDIGEWQGERFLTMEFVDGTTLKNVVSREAPDANRLPLARTIELLLPVCAGLGAAHTAGVLHRDLKPDNVLVAHSGRVVITDFGIAGGLHSQEEGTGTRVPIGTPAYMSPEQVEGKADLDARSDLYQLGVVLFELLTGELPFRGSTTAGVMMGRILEPPPDPRGKNPEIPEAAAALVLRLMAKKREDRHGSAEEVAAALRTLRHLALHAPRSAGPRRAATADEPTLMIEVGAQQTGDAIAAGAVREARGRAPVELAPEPAPPLRKTVAVLPLVNHAGREDQLLVDGLTEALIDALSGMEEVRVLSRGAVSQPALAGLTPRSAGQALGAQSTLSGSVRRAGTDLVVSLQLLGVKDGIQVMARRYQRSGAAAAILGVTDEAARDVAAALAAPDQAVSVGPLSDPRVAELYLRARQSYHRSGMINVSESCTLFEQALALTPNDPTLLSYCAMAQARRWFFGGEGAGERAYRTAEQAVALAPRRGEPFLALATVRFQSLDHAGAIAAVREALARMPALVDGYDIVGHLLMEAGPLRSGLQYLEYALALDPGLHRAHLDIARAYALRGAWDQAEQQIARAGTASTRSTALWVTRARLTLWQRDRAAAAELLTRPNLPPAEYPLARRLLEVIISGQPAPIEELFGSGTPWALSSPRSRVWRLQLTAEVQAFCGAHAEALRTVEQAVDAKLIDLMWLERCPLLAPLRKAARWPALRHTVEGRAAGVHRALGWPTTTAQAAAARG